MHSKCEPNVLLQPTQRGGRIHALLLQLLKPEYTWPQAEQSLLSSGRTRSPEERVNPIVLGELNVKTERQGTDRVEVLLSGKSSSRDAGRELQPVLERLLSLAREERRALVLHFERLEYFNSSTIAALVQFIRTAQQAGVSVVVRYDARLKWQAMSFDALRRALKPFEAQGGPSISFLDASEA